MRILPVGRILLVSLILTIAGMAGLSGQAPFTAIGLGYPVPPVDARTAALGSTGVGLLGDNFTLRNPADLTQHTTPGFNITTAPERLTVEAIEGENSTGRQGLSVVRAVIPFLGFVGSFAFGAELDQDWSVAISDTLVLEAGTYPVDETRQQDGGISTIDLSLARQLGPLSIGVSAQRLIGSVRQSFARRFEAPLDPGSPLLGDLVDSRVASYRAWRFKVGAGLDIVDRILISGAYGWTGDLTVDPQDPEIPGGTVDLPPVVDLGASAIVTRHLLLTLAGGWAGWSRADEALPGAAAYDVKWGGAGIEFRSLRILGLDVPLRLGGRKAELPFAPEDAPQATETAFGGGFGLEFRAGLAAADLALEFGTRGNLDETGLEESFRRLTISFTIRQ